MTDYIIVDDATNVIVNRIVLDASAEWQPEEGHRAIEETSPMSIGGKIVDGVYTPPAPLDPVFYVPQSISDRQFFQQLAVNGIITEDQALASNAAVIPQPLLDIIDKMPADQQFGVKMLVSGATTFERNNPVTVAIGQAYGMNSRDIDSFFAAAAAL